MIHLELSTVHKKKISPSLLEAAAATTLQFEAKPDVDLSIVLTGDARIQDLNREFLQQDRPTDVIAFPAGDVDLDTGRVYLGDVVISMPRARAQAKARGHSLEAEVQLLVVHGVLHLLGHDHAGTEEKARMWAAQAQILSRLGLSADIVHE